ncbi:MAG: glycoside hydrolase family 3 C-terminal domain-containing protein [Spirochaetales bacterium]|nr:glycoside hydrolase family 3 C-terminal domain-containing protein [Spirochaetales bacterium]
MKVSKKYRLGFTEKAKTIVNKLSLEEKVSLMSGSISLEEMVNSMGEEGQHYNYIPYSAGGIPEKNIDPMLFCDGPRGVVCGTGKSTAFPVSMLRGASFDTELEEKIGRAIAREIRAYKGNTFAGVCINLPYNPGWGRSQETYGEDSFHLGAMGSALVKGVQENGVIACIKHYAFNQMEISRFKVSVDCDKRTEREVFLSHFKDCIDTGAAAVMSSYNLYKGTHCGHHDYLLNKVLKDEWDFDGFVMSDFVWGVRDTVEAANGGQDMEMCCTQFFGEKLVKAVKDGLVKEEKINEAALRIIRTIMAFKETFKDEISEDVIGCKEHIALALESARKGITLLKNNETILPLDKNKLSKVLVLGKLAVIENTGDHGSSWVYPPYVVTPLKGLAEHSGQCEVIHYDGKDLGHACKLAKEADAVVFVVGYDHNDEGEFISEDQVDSYTGAAGGDRLSLELHEDEIELLNKVGPVNRKSVAVLIGGNTILMEKWKDSVSAILMAYYPGMEGGTALGEIIFGEVNPSGKLPYVLPSNEKDLPQVDWNTTKQHYDYYHGYAKLEKEGITPSLPYGFGLSYTSFSISNPEFTKNETVISATCDVKNTGDRAGDEVVQLYIGFGQSKIDRPKKSLKGFTRVSLTPGEQKRISISCPIEKLSWFNSETGKMEIESIDYDVFIGTSSDEKDLLCGKINL